MRADSQRANHAACTGLEFPQREHIQMIVMIVRQQQQIKRRNILRLIQIGPGKRLEEAAHRRAGVQRRIHGNRQSCEPHEKTGMPEPNHAAFGQFREIGFYGRNAVDRATSLFAFGEKLHHSRGAVPIDRIEYGIEILKRSVAKVRRSLNAIESCARRLGA